MPKSTQNLVWENGFIIRAIPNRRVEAIKVEGGWQLYTFRFTKEDLSGKNTGYLFEYIPRMGGHYLKHVMVITDEIARCIALGILHHQAQFAISTELP